MTKTKKKQNLSANIKYSVVANFITMLISIISIIIFPKILGTSSYGYYQLYLFYISFAGIIHFGIIDGILLNFAGLSYNDIVKKRVINQFWILSILQLIITLPIISMINFIIKFNYNQFIVIVLSLICIVITNQRSLILSVLQSSNRIYEYSKLTRIDRIIFIFPAIIYLLFLGNNFTVLIMIDLVCRFLALIYGIFLIRNDFFKTISIEKKDILETIKLSKSGLNLTFSFLSNQLITGVIRLSIQNKWSITEFGKISLTLSLSNMFLTFINAISATLFPHLRKIEVRLYSDIYEKYRAIFVSLTFGILVLFYPMADILNIWLPEYKDSIYYMGILFPMFVYEAKTSLITNTFLKTIRKEKIIFFSNISALIISIVFSLIFVFIFSSIELTVFLILFVVVIKSEISEIFLSKYLNKSTLLMRLQEYVLTLVFVGVNLYLPLYFALLGYILIYFVYMMWDGKYKAIIAFYRRKSS
ncbi:oligosaccharide flippase family protein [Enterococcus dispar]|uniref:oligosaccharide flippase family protein n=1 Tax=Enterococcus dispar TaxID=44009 RepID=UPI0021D47A17|nr:oligosaccharide flippase family protein [Enterococcus dispar]